MTMTTIKVDSETRDRLKSQATVAGLTLGQHLGRLADAADRAKRLDSVGAAVAASSAADLASWIAETEEWDAAELGSSHRGS